jgi:hypothetical protein
VHSFIDFVCGQASPGHPRPSPRPPRFYATLHFRFYEFKRTPDSRVPSRLPEIVPTRVPVIYTVFKVC